MSCNSKIDSFFSKSKKMIAGLSYAMYKETNFGNTEDAERLERYLKNIKSISWLLKKHEYSTCDCNKGDCLCAGADSDWKVENESVKDDVIEGFNGTYWPETWKGFLFNPDLGKNVSLSTFGDGLSNVHTGIRIYSWVADVPTLIYEEDGILDIIQGGVVSFVYSKEHCSYYFRAGYSGDTMVNTVFKLLGNFSSPAVSDVLGTPNPSLVADQGMAIADEKGLIFINTSTGVILGLSLIDFSTVKTINTTGFYYQKMTWNPGECNLILTGNFFLNAQIHYVDVDAETVTNKLDDATLSNNTSLILKNGDLLVLTSGKTFPNITVQFQRWSSCDGGELKSTTDTGLLAGVGNPDFFTLHTLAEDDAGNIYVSHIVPGTTLSVFDRDFNFLYTKDLPATPAQNWGQFATNFVPNWSNNNINNTEGSILILPAHKDGVGGNGSYYLDYKTTPLERIKPECIVLTNEEISSLVNKLNAVIVPRTYKSLGLNTNIKNIKDCNRLFVFQQETPSVLWTINHNLNTFPVIIAVDNLGNKITGLETYVSKNTVTILFSVPVAGTAYLTYNIQ